MFEWSEEQLMIRDAVRQFVDKEIRPHVEELEHGDLPPYDILRKLFKTFGMDAMAKAGFEKRMEREETRGTGGPHDDGEVRAPRDDDGEGGGAGAGMTLLPI